MKFLFVLLVAICHAENSTDVDIHPTLEPQNFLSHTPIVQDGPQSSLDSIFMSLLDLSNHEIIVVESGKVNSEFSCEAENLSSELAMIPSTSSFIKFEVKTAKSSSGSTSEVGWSTLDYLLDWAGDEEQFTAAQELFLVDLDFVKFDLQVLERELQEDEIPTPNPSAENEILKITAINRPSYAHDENGMSKSLKFVFMCERAGRVRVKATMGIRESNETLCVSFVKRCAATWGGLKVSDVDSGSVIIENDRVAPAWAEPQMPEGSAATEPPSFALSLLPRSGSVRISEIRLDSSLPDSLEPLLRGGLDSDRGDLLELLGGDEVTLEIGYHCPNSVLADDAGAGPAKITITLINEQPLVAPLSFSWYAECSRSSIPKLSVVSSPCERAWMMEAAKPFTRDPVVVWDNNTLADEFSRNNSEHFVSVAEEHCTLFTFTTMPTDADFEMQNNGLGFPPLSPRPTISFDEKMIYIFGHGPEVKKSSDKVEIRVRYICFIDGTSPMHLMTTFKGVPSYNFYWDKVCVAPSIREASGISASSLPFLSFGLLAAISAGLCCTGKGKTLLRRIGAKPAGANQSEREGLRS